MTRPRPGLEHARARLAALRARERGASVFIVVLVLTMLTGIGLFAARSAMLATEASGYERQMTQTHYLTEYAVLSATSELSSTRREAYVKLMATQPDPNCTSVKRISDNNWVTNRTCYRFGYKDLENVLKLQPGNNSFLIAPTPPTTPGSLGQTLLDPDFVVEMTDLGPATPPVAGTDLTSSGAANVQFVSVTLNATGQIRPYAVGPNVDLAAGRSASVELSRAHLVVGPLPKL